MGYVTSIFARRVVQGAGRSVDGPGLLRSLGLDPEAPLDVTQMVAEDAYYDFLERLAGQMVNAHELPVRVGPLMRPDDYGALGLAWKSAPTIRQSLERIERFCRLWTDNMTYELRDDEEGTLFVLHRAGERRLGLRLSNECTAASAVSLIRQTSTERFRPRRVLFKHRAPEITTAHQRYFGCPVEFEAALDAVSISDEALERPNHLGDDAISRFLMPHLEAEVEAIAGEDPLELLVQRAVSRALSDGVPKMAEIARRMGTSERTLQRRLADEGLSFKNLVNDTRRRLAENLMQQPRYSLSEVGFLTGFSEQSAFSRAFKRWTGRSPAAYREARG